jgi:NADPH-dependent 2,4-dienoyl-CoA reductase/sulfur reductase-like enzyme
MTVSTGAELWRALDLKITREEYSSTASSPSSSSKLPCDSVSVLVVGAGPAGLRTAIEAELLGARTLVLEKRKSFSR